MGCLYTKGLPGLITMLFYGYTTEKSAQRYGNLPINQMFFVFCAIKCLKSGMKRSVRSAEIEDNGQMVAVSLRVVFVSLPRPDGSFAEVLGVVFQQEISRIDADRSSFVHSRGYVELVET